LIRGILQTGEKAKSSQPKPTNYESHKRGNEERGGSNKTQARQTIMSVPQILADSITFHDFSASYQLFFKAEE